MSRRWLATTLALAIVASQYSEIDYFLYHGTSAAAPVVSGVAALVKLANPKLTALQIKEILLASARQNDDLSEYVNKGRVVNAFSAVQAAIQKR